MSSSLVNTNTEAAMRINIEINTCRNKVESKYFLPRRIFKNSKITYVCLLRFVETKIEITQWILQQDI